MIGKEVNIQLRMTLRLLTNLPKALLHLVTCPEFEIIFNSQRVSL